MEAIALPDGRQLDVDVSGPPEGMPVVFHHGTPGSAPPFRDIQRAIHARGLRLVTLSRPGYGGSSRQPGRSVAAIVPDVECVLEHLGVDTCLTAGWSGGGPHALATAALLPIRTAGVLVIAGVAPFHAAGLEFLAGMGQDNIEEFTLAAAGESPLRRYLEQVAPGMRSASAAAIIEEMASLLSPVDVEALTTELGQDFEKNFAEALRPGIDGWLDDDLAFVRPWGFDLDAITVPTFLWQGTADLMVPPAHGAWLAAHLPGAKAHLEQGGGHLSIAVGAIDRMLDELVDALAGPRKATPTSRPWER